MMIRILLTFFGTPNWKRSYKTEFLRKVFYSTFEEISIINLLIKSKFAFRKSQIFEEMPNLWDFWKTAFLEEIPFLRKNFFGKNCLPEIFFQLQNVYFLIIKYCIVFCFCEILTNFMKIFFWWKSDTVFMFVISNFIGALDY